MIGKTIEWGRGIKGVVMDSVLSAQSNAGSSTYYLVKATNGAIHTVSPSSVTYIH
jgi:hypothetical protein